MGSDRIQGSRGFFAGWNNLMCRHTHTVQVPPSPAAVTPQRQCWVVTSSYMCVTNWRERQVWSEDSGDCWTGTHKRWGRKVFCFAMATWQLVVPCEVHSAQKYQLAARVRLTMDLPQWVFMTLTSSGSTSQGIPAAIAIWSAIWSKNWWHESDLPVKPR